MVGYQIYEVQCWNEHPRGGGEPRWEIVGASASQMTAEILAMEHVRRGQATRLMKVIGETASMLVIPT